MKFQICSLLQLALAMGDRESFSWTVKITDDFLEIYGEFKEKFINVNYKNAALWDEIAYKLRSTDGERQVWPSAQQCNNRWKSLKSSTQKYLDSLKETGSMKKKEPPFHKAVLALIRDKCSVVPLAVVDSGSALPVTMPPEDESSLAASVAAANRSRPVTPTANRSRSVTPTAGDAARMATEDTRAEQHNEGDIPIVAAQVVPVSHAGTAVRKKPLAEGAASKSKAADRRQKRASAATAFSAFVKKQDDREKKRSKDVKKRHKEKMKVMGGFLEVMQKMAGQCRKRRRHEAEETSSSSESSSTSPLPSSPEPDDESDAEGGIVAAGSLSGLDQ